MSDFMNYFVLMLILLAMCFFVLTGFLTLGSSNKDNRITIALEEFESLNLTNSDIGRIYLECLKECDDEHSNYDFLELCFDACKELKNYKDG